MFSSSSVNSYPSRLPPSLSYLFLSAFHGLLASTLHFFSFWAFSPASLTHSLLCALQTPVPPRARSSLSAGCRGGTFTFIMSRINLRVRELLFSSLLRQDLGFFQETKTGGSWSPGPGFPWTPCCSVTLHLHAASPRPASMGPGPGAALLSFGMWWRGRLHWCVCT